MDLNAVKLFVVAVEAGSISAAARRTGMPLPTLSRHLRALEDALGVRLFERGPKGLALTLAGHQLLTDVQPALLSLEQAEASLQDASGVAGRLRVSMPPHLEVLWPLFRAFRRQFPAVTFDVFVTDRRVDLVADGVDVALRVGDEGAASYVGRILCRYRHRLVASPTFLAAHPVSAPVDLGRVPVACWRRPGPYAWQLGDHQVPLEPVFVTNDYVHLLNLAEAGEVVTEVPPFIAQRSLDGCRVVEVLAHHPLPERPIRALVVERRAMSLLTRRFLDHVSEHLPQSFGIVAPSSQT